MARAVPVSSGLTEGYWAAAAREELAVQRCTACARYISLPEEECPDCAGTDLVFETVRGTGTIFTYSVVHRTFAPGFAERVPYVIAWIELDEPAGVRMFGNVLTDHVDEVEIGQRVEVVFEELPGFGRIPNFRPSEAAS